MVKEHENDNYLIEFAAGGSLEIDHSPGAINIIAEHDGNGCELRATAAEKDAIADRLERGDGGLAIELTEGGHVEIHPTRLACSDRFGDAVEFDLTPDERSALARALRRAHVGD